MQPVQVLSIKKNIMGTISIEMKAQGMRKPQDFIVYPIDEDAKNITIQSSTRIARIDVNGKGKMSRPHSGGAYFLHLQIDKLTEVEFAEDDWKVIKSQIMSTAGEAVGKSFIKSNNSGAVSIFDL